MSGPNDSGPGETATSDFKLTLPEIGAPSKPSERFRLKIDWMTPHLQWRPIRGPVSADPGGLAPSAPPPPPDPDTAVDETDRYFKYKMLFDLRLPNWALVDRAYVSAPTDTPVLLPTFAQLKEWEDETFYRGLGRPRPLFGAPAPSPLLTPPLLAPPPPSLFYKLPDPAAMNREPGPPRAGEVGDVLKAVWGLPITQRLATQATDEAHRQLRWLKRDWDTMSGWSRLEAITLSATFAASAIGTVMGVGEVRHRAFKSLLGVDLPVPFVPGTSFKITDYGPANNFLLGPPAAGAQQSNRYGFMITVDVREAVKTVGKYF